MAGEILVHVNFLLHANFILSNKPGWRNPGSYNWDWLDCGVNWLMTHAIMNKDITYAQCGKVIITLGGLITFVVNPCYI